MHVFCSVDLHVTQRTLFILQQMRVPLRERPLIIICNPSFSGMVLNQCFFNRRAADQYRVLASIVPGRERFSWNLSFLVF